MNTAEPFASMISRARICDATSVGRPRFGSNLGVPGVEEPEPMINDLVKRVEMKVSSDQWRLGLVLEQLVESGQSKTYLTKR